MQRAWRRSKVARVTSLDEVVAQALARQECVLVRDGTRRVLLLDGSTVIVEGDGAGRFKSMNVSAAKDDFRERIAAALNEGFAPAHRDPPKAVAFVQPQRALAASPPPRPVTPTSPAPRAPAGLDPSLWMIHGNAAQFRVDELDGPVPELLHEGQVPADVTFLDVKAETPEDALDVLADGLPRWVRGLGLITFEAVESFDAAQLDPSPVWPLVTPLEALELRAGEVLPLPSSLPNLASLGVWTMNTSPALLESLVASPWPKLTQLELWLDGVDAGDVKRRLTRAVFPALRHLALYGIDGDIELSGLSSLQTNDVTRGTSPFPPPSTIDVLSENRLYPLRSSRFRGR